MTSSCRRTSLWLAALCLSLAAAGCPDGCTPPPEDGGPNPDEDGGGGGDDVDCHSYCDLVLEGCTGDYKLFDDHDACMAVCEHFPANGTVGDASGNTLQCRHFHASVTADDPATHCPHASPQGGGVCGTWCDVYCANMASHCEGPGFDDVGTCLATCAAMPQDGAWNAADGNNVQCRVFHAIGAQGDNSHCAHASITGGGACGGECDAYCDQVMRNCNGTASLYGNRTTCLNTCAHFPTDGAWDATAGNSVQCRAFHGAGAAANDAATHCGHASANGGDGVCGDACDGYCDLVMGNCTGGNELYASEGACLTACGAFPSGSAYATTGDNVQCRTYHAIAAHDDATHCAHAAEDSGGVCEDEAAPAQSVSISGFVHELGSHLNGTHTGVADANILLYGVEGNISTQSSNVAGSVGNYTLAGVPASGQAVFFVSKAGYHPTYQSASIGTQNLTGVGLVLAGTAWLTAVATEHGVNHGPGNQFACQFDAALQCMYVAVMGQILDDGTGASAAQPVEGVAADDFTVTGGADNVAWRKMGPYFLNADGTAAAGNTTSQAAGLYVMFVEIPATASGYESVHIEIAISYDDNGMRYFGPTHTAAYRSASTTVSWADVRETGIAPEGQGGNVSFDGQIYPLFLPVADGGYGCQGCHTNQGGATPAGGLNLKGGADVAYASLDPANYPARVNVSDPDASTLLTKPLYQGGGNQNHPIFAWVSVNDAAYKLIRQWISEGGQRVQAAQRVSFAADIHPLLGPTGGGGMGCTSCHTGGAAGALQLDGNVNAMYGELVTEAAQDASGSGEGFRVNKQGFPERSLLLTNLLTGSGEDHPQKLFASSADARYQLLYRWISEGYQNDAFCEGYCDDIAANCTGNYEQYANRAACLSACGAMPVGADGDTAVDTAYCRIYHVGAANNDDHCYHAGPSGGGVCGDWCNAYCRQSQQGCTGDNKQYPDNATCLSLCGDIPSNGNVGDADGDTVQCRSYHLQVAVGGDQTHCPHAGFSGDGVCGDRCDVYCRNMGDYCAASYANDNACQTACGGFGAGGAWDDLTGDTVQCRVGHVMYAKGDAAHCDHADENSAAGTCQ